ncbi:hypothetical protein PRZ48_003147 [Zasmidium cellare]|uniref:Uncharacterized protein n=1 Tax=Zasmidium cellare TaxID=395010 RepID=A0ABR0EUU8_ZASCE|nr:hypothetical protein PRZ48_003147 [Zasmidium cellare]
MVYWCNRREYQVQVPRVQTYVDLVHRLRHAAARGRIISWDPETAETRSTSEGSSEQQGRGQIVLDGLVVPGEASNAVEDGKLRRQTDQEEETLRGKDSVAQMNIANDDLTMIPTGVDSLESLAFADLELIKSQLDTFRHRILALQNSRSPLFQLPGELRNKIFLFAMYAELLERKRNLSRHPNGHLYKTPGFFSVSRQIHAECMGVWFSDVLVWEEFDVSKQSWRQLGMEEIDKISSARTTSGDTALVTKLAHCDLGRTRGGVEASRSICTRKGLVRMQGEDEIVGFPKLRWWVW